MKTFRWAILALCAGALVAQAGTAQAQSCRMDQRFGSPAAAGYKTDLNANLGDWGTLFMEADTATSKTCFLKARDYVRTKVKDQNVDPARWRGSLQGGDVFLLTAAAMRLGAQGLLTSDIHAEVRKALGAYEFVHHGGGCGRSGGNGCMDDYTVAAAGHAWAAAYVWYTQSSVTTPAGSVRDFGWFAGRAREYLELSLSPEKTLCVRPLSSSMCTTCSDQYNFGYAHDLLSSTDASQLRNAIVGGQVEILSFEHLFENPSYGIGLLPLVSIAVQGLEVAGTPWTPTEFQKVMAHGLFRTGQRHAPQTSNVCQATWLDNCVGMGCSLSGAPCQSTNCDPPPHGCADGFGYTAGMYPVKPLLDNELRLATISSPIYSWPYYQFDQFEGVPGLCATNRFSPTAAFFNDGRYAGYYQIPYQWAYVDQPPVWGVSPAQYVDAPSPGQVVRSGATTFSGWAFDGEKALSAASFSFALDGSPIALQSFTYGGWRGDVCQAMELIGPVTCAVGWSGTFTPPWWLATGNHTLTVTVTVQHATGSSTSTFRRQFYYQP